MENRIGSYLTHFNFKPLWCETGNRGMGVGIVIVRLLRELTRRKTHGVT
jgi:hypothetical protein